MVGEGLPANRDLDRAMNDGRFREDLFYRLCGDTIRVPSLAARLRSSRSELHDLVAHLAVEVAGEDEAADLATTLWFFHTRGIQHELHPGIRLFGYAFGRTVGPVLGKALQLLGILAVASVLPRLAFSVLVLATATYAAAVAYNIAQM